MQVADPLDALKFSEDILKSLTGTLQPSLECLPSIGFSNDKTITPELDKCVVDISLTGLSCYPWKLLQELLFAKLEQVCTLFNCA